MITSDEINQQYLSGQFCCLYIPEKWFHVSASLQIKQVIFLPSFVVTWQIKTLDWLTLLPDSTLPNGKKCFNLVISGFISFFQYFFLSDFLNVHSIHSWLGKRNQKYWQTFNELTIVTFHKPVRHPLHQIHHVPAIGMPIRTFLLEWVSPYYHASLLVIDGADGEVIFFTSFQIQGNIIAIRKSFHCPNGIHQAKRCKASICKWPSATQMVEMPRVSWCDICHQWHWTIWIKCPGLKVFQLLLTVVVVDVVVVFIFIVHEVRNKLSLLLLLYIYVLAYSVNISTN